MPRQRVPLVATVSCRADSRGEQRPLAVTVGGRRLRVAGILEHAIVTAADPGEPVRDRFTIELEDGALVILERRLPAGEWRVWRIDPA